MTKQSFPSVWDAIEETPEAIENMKLRATIMQALEQHVREQGWTQAETAKHLGVAQPRVSDLMRGKITLFSLDMLVNMAVVAGLHVELTVSRAA